jgi:hypothetical protein
MYVDFSAVHLRAMKTHTNMIAIKHMLNEISDN